jgi:hypothetical protein
MPSAHNNHQLQRSANLVSKLNPVPRYSVLGLRQEPLQGLLELFLNNNLSSSSPPLLPRLELLVSPSNQLQRKTVDLVRSVNLNRPSNSNSLRLAILLALSVRTSPLNHPLDLQRRTHLALLRHLLGRILNSRPTRLDSLPKMPRPSAPSVQLPPTNLRHLGKQRRSHRQVPLEPLGNLSLRPNSNNQLNRLVSSVLELSVNRINNQTNSSRHNHLCLGQPQHSPLPQEDLVPIFLVTTLSNLNKTLRLSLRHSHLVLEDCSTSPLLLRKPVPICLARSASPRTRERQLLNRISLDRRLWDNQQTSRHRTSLELLNL